MRPGKPRHVAVACKQGIVVGLYLRRSRRQQRQRQQPKGAVGHDDQVFRRLPAVLHIPEQIAIKLRGELQVERGNIGNHRRFRLECLAQLGHLGIEVADAHLDPRELDRAVFSQDPDETVEPTEIKREQRFIIGELLLDIGGARRRRIDEVAVFREFSGDIFQSLGPRGLQRRDFGLRGLQGFFLTFGRRQRQQVVQGGDGGADLLFAVLRRAHQLGQFRLVGCRARRGCLQRALNRLAAQHVRIAEGFFGDIGRSHRRIERQHPQIALDHEPDAPFTGGGRRAGVVVAAARGCQQYRDRFLEGLQRFRRSSTCGPAQSQDSRVRPRY